MRIVRLNNYLQDITVVAFGGWNSKHRHAIGGSVDRDNRNSILDRYDKEYFTIENAINCIQKEKKALDALRYSLSSSGFI